MKIGITHILAGMQAALLRFSVADAARNPALVAFVQRNRRVLVRSLTGASLLCLAIASPVAAQDPSPAPDDQREITYSSINANGTESSETQSLGPGDKVFVQTVNGEIVSKRVIPADDMPRVIIKLREAPLAATFGKALRRMDMQSSKRQREHARGDFRRRLLSIENRHRTRKGMMNTTETALVHCEYSYCLSGVAARVQADAIDDIREMPEVEAVYLDQKFSKFNGYGIAQIGAPLVWDQLGVTGSGVTIAVIDTGIDYTHPDLGGGIGAGFKILGGHDFVNLDDDPADDNGHGTHVAGIAAANGEIRGVAPDANLLAIKVLDMYGDGFGSDIIAGIEWAVANDADIINLSLGGPGEPNDPMSQAVDQATQAGVLVVAASGNDYRYTTVGSPALARTALAVGADDANRQMAAFSSRGPAPFTYQIKPELVAPGVGILSTVPTGGTIISDPSGYALLDGTSMASPHVAGAAALLLQQSPEMGPHQLKIALIDGALDLSEDVMTQGSGEIDVFASATSPLKSDGGELSFGWDDIRLPAFASSQSITISNTTSEFDTISFGTSFDTPDGVSVTVSPSSLSLQPGESATVTFSLNVDNAVTPDLPVAPFAYGGLLVATNGDGDSIHRPFAFSKAPKLTLLSDSFIGTVRQFRDSDSPQSFFFDRFGPVEWLVPAGNYDYMIDLLNDLGSSLDLRVVFREDVEVSAVTELTVLASDAKNRIEILPTDENGALLEKDFISFNHRFYKAESGSSLGYQTSGYMSSALDFNYFSVSDVSSDFTWDAGLMAYSDDPSEAAYIFNGALHDGITESKTFDFQPADLHKSVMLHKRQPGISEVKPYVGMYRVDSTGFSGSLFRSNQIVETPHEQTIYSVLPAVPEAAFGFWTAGVSALVPSGNLPFIYLDAIYKSQFFRPVSRKALGAFDAFGEVYRTRAKSLLIGQGPAYWSGQMRNDSDMIHLQARVTSLAEQKLFAGQLGEELVHGLLEYSLIQDDQMVEYGTMDEAMEFRIGRLKIDLVNIPVIPGPYELVIPFDQFYMNDEQGHLEVRQVFDTTRSDPNPPSLTSFQLVDRTDRRNRYPFIDAIPFIGAELRFGAQDDVQVSDVRLSFKIGNHWIPLHAHLGDGNQYSAYVPGFWIFDDAVELKLEVTDTSGNSLILTEAIPKS